VSRSV